MDREKRRSHYYQSQYMDNTRKMKEQGNSLEKKEKGIEEGKSESFTWSGTTPVFHCANVHVRLQKPQGFFLVFLRVE